MNAAAEPSDGELLTAWRGGDTRAGNTIVARHARAVLRFFRRKLDVGAEDLVQRTFVAAVEGRDRVEQTNGFRAYVLGIAHHELMRHFKRKGRSELPPLDGPTAVSPSAAVRMLEEQRLLLVALRTLPLDLQITLELHYWEEMTTAEIATVLGVAAGTIKWRLSRARALLAEAIEAIPADANLRRSAVDGLDRWVQSMRTVLADND
jgi:RNA polymerase sigma factor (sigma-70 family)